MHLFIYAYDNVVFYDIPDNAKSKYTSQIVKAIAVKGIPNEVERETISLLKYLIQMGDLGIDSLNWLNLIQDMVDKCPPDETLKEVTELIEELNENHDIDCDEVIALAQDSVQERCMNNVHDFVSERISCFESVDADTIKFAEEMIEEYKIELNFTAKDLLEHVDFESIRQEFMDDEYETDKDKIKTSQEPTEFNEIEDLFERT